jgi:hypothetical protein
VFELKLARLVDQPKLEVKSLSHEREAWAVMKFERQRREEHFLSSEIPLLFRDKESRRSLKEINSGRGNHQEISRKAKSSTDFQSLD